MRAILILLFATLTARAGIYSPDEPFYFELDEKGFAKPIQFTGGFDSILAGVRAIAIDKPDQPPHPNRLRALRRVADRKGGPLTEEAMAGLTADLFYLGRGDEALTLLQPLTRDRSRSNFLLYAHLARAHAGRGEWREAVERQRVALDYGLPASFGRYSKDEMKWLQRVEREYLRLLMVRADEATRRRPGEAIEDVDPILAARGGPRLQFVGPDGKYQVGKISDEERAKLPADALAICQQLVLWHPNDARLYWLLAELYNAEGDFEAAARIMDECSFAMGLRSPTLREHKQVLEEAAKVASQQRADEAERQQAKAEQERLAAEQEERDYRKRFQWIVACGVALAVLLVYYQFRDLRRRLQRRAARG